MVKRHIEETVDKTFQDLIMKRGRENNVVSVVVSGPPASGKTQVCRTYATAAFEKRKDKGLYLPVLLWKAGTAADLANSLRDSLKMLCNPDYLKRIDPDSTLMHTTEQVYKHRLDYLLKEVLKVLKDKYSRRPDSEKNEEWLIVIDGASSYDELTGLMPCLLSERGASSQWGRGKLLIAVQERITDKWQYMEEIRLGPGLSQSESLEFLKLSFPDDCEEDLKNVAEQLSHIPLSLAVAVETMKLLRKDNTFYTWQRHLEKNLLPADSVKSADRKDPRHPQNLPCQYNETLYQALKLAVKRIGVEGNNAQLFFFLGLCEEGTVPLQLLKKLAVFLHGDDREGSEDALFVQFDEDIRQNCLGLILLDGDAGISVHHVLHVVLRDIAHSRLEGRTPADESEFEIRRNVSAIIKAFCCLYQSIEQQSQGSYLDSVQDKLRLLPHFLAVFRICIQSPYGYQDATVPRFTGYVAQLLQLRRDGSQVREVLKTGITVAAAVTEIDIFAELELKSMYAKELVEANEFPSAIDLLHETIRIRKDELLQEESQTSDDLDQYAMNFKGLHGDLIALGYAFKDRGEEDDLFEAEKHVDEVFELLQRLRPAVISSEDWGVMRSEALLLQAQLNQDLQRYDPNLLEELLEESREGAPASQHNCQVLRTLTDLLLENGPQYDVSKAGILIDRAIDMGHHLYGEVHPMLAYSMMTKGRVLLEKGDFENALKMLAEALSLNDRLPAELRGNVIVPLVDLFRGHCYIHQGRYKEAYDVLRDSAALTKVPKYGFGPGHPQNAFVMDKLGQVCMHLMQLEEAKQYMEESLHMKERIFGKSHPELNWNYMQLESVAYECNNDEEALMFRAKRLKLLPEDNAYM